MWLCLFPYRILPQPLLGEYLHCFWTLRPNACLRTNAPWFVIRSENSQRWSICIQVRLWRLHEPYGLLLFGSEYFEDSDSWRTNALSQRPLVRRSCGLFRLWGRPSSEVFPYKSSRVLWSCGTPRRSLPRDNFQPVQKELLRWWNNSQRSSFSVSHPREQHPSCRTKSRQAVSGWTAWNFPRQLQRPALPILWLSYLAGLSADPRVSYR